MNGVLCFDFIELGRMTQGAVRDDGQVVRDEWWCEEESKGNSMSYLHTQTWSVKVDLFCQQFQVERIGRYICFGWFYNAKVVSIRFFQWKSKTINQNERKINAQEIGMNFFWKYGIFEEKRCTFLKQDGKAIRVKDEPTLNK